MVTNSTIIRRFYKSLIRVLRTHYPAFVFGMELRKGMIPVFVYHDIESDIFTADLEFLRTNNYRTLTLKEFLEASKNGRRDRSVVLTFDDARRNFWEVAFPLLKKYEVRATVFVPTFWIDGECEFSYLSQRGSKKIFMNWEQLGACKISGLVDVESHGHRHALIYKSPKLEAFASPYLLEKYDLFDWPMRFEANTEMLGLPPLGTPVYSATPLLSAEYRIIEDESISQACRDLVEAGGGVDFFKAPKALRRLNEVYLKVLSSSRGFTVIDKDIFLHDVEKEFLMSSKIFSEKMGYHPRCFAFPWELGSEESIKCGINAGLKAVFGVGMDYSRIRNRKSGILCFYRIKGDWLRFLPGKGRKSLFKEVVRKLRGFQESHHLVH